MSSVVVRRVSLQCFRNFDAAELVPGPRLNVIAGDNGQGKTSLLEGLYFAATSRSFRTEQVRELIQHGRPGCGVAMTVAAGGLEYEQRASLRSGRRVFALDGKRVERIVDYATRTPMVAFHPGDLQLVSGAAVLRRRLLDRLMLYLDPIGAEARSRYGQALRERQRLLDTRGPEADELDAYEAVLARDGARLCDARARVVTNLVPALTLAFEELMPTSSALAAVFRPAGVTDAAEFQRALRERRRADWHRKAATFGPQRDELELSIDGRGARHAASQGQQRILALALKLAELDCVRHARGVDPILLLDDVSSELDPTRTGAVYGAIRATPCQVFVTTTRPELFSSGGVGAPERTDFVLRSGRVEART